MQSRTIILGGDGSGEEGGSGPRWGQDWQQHCTPNVDPLPSLIYLHGSSWTSADNQGGTSPSCTAGAYPEGDLQQPKIPWDAAEAVPALLRCHTQGVG